MNQKERLGFEKRDRGWMLALAGIILCLFVTGAPTGGAFSFPDSPRHALNAAFVMDVMAAAPVSDPIQFAYDYYSRYPGLTILLYPPLYYFAIALVYAVFGVSQEAALIGQYVFYLVFASGVYYLSRAWCPRPEAFGAALIMVSAPEVAYWGRQIMLEVPAFAFAVWSAVFLVNYTRTERPLYLYLCTLAIMASLYTKLSVAFLLIPYTLVLARMGGWRVLSDKHSWMALALAGGLTVPLLFLTVEFGQTNLESVAGVADSHVSRASLAGWVWYARQLPGQIGWPVVSVALLSGIAVILRSEVRRGWKSNEGVLLTTWFVSGYVFFSAIDLKEARHSIYILLPVAIVAVLGVESLLPRGWARVRAGTVLCLAGVTLGQTVTSRPVHFVDGYREVVGIVADLAPRDSVVLFSGYRDGSFIFNMRVREDRRDLYTLRADKLLLSIAVRRELGVEQRDYSEKEIGEELSRLGVHYVVAQPDFWTDLEQMRRLQNVLMSSQFEVVGRVTTGANYPAQERELVVYRNLGDVAEGPIELMTEIPMIERTISTTVQ